MKHVFFYAIILLSATIAFTSFSAKTYDFGNKAEAKKLAEKAAEHIKNIGLEETLKQINNKSEVLFEKDLYVFIIDHKGEVLAHGLKGYDLVGDDALRRRDSKGNFFIQDMMNIKDRGWIKYWWPNPTTKKAYPKETYIIHLPDGIFIGVGAYNTTTEIQEDVKQTIPPLIAR